MAELTLIYEVVDLDGNFPVAISRFEQQSEQRRLISSKKVRALTIRSPKLTKAGVQEWEDFYDARSGQLDQFTLKDPINGNFDEDLNVRFASKLRQRFANAYYTVTVDLLVVNQDES